MSIAQKFLMGVVAVAGLTAVLLPGRQTVPVIGALTDFVRGTVATAMGTGKVV